MEAKAAIVAILKAKKIEDILDISNVKSEFDRLIKLVHPDRCSLPQAHDASSKLITLRDVFEKGRAYTDDIGQYHTNGYFADFSGEKDFLTRSLANYKRLKFLKDPTSKHFQRYLPEDMEMRGDILHLTFAQRAVPLCALQLPQEHVNWILSRMLEYIAWFSQMGYVHAGITPESIFVVPETHGIIFTSFYHMTEIDRSLTTISAKYKHWYPSCTFDDKKAVPLIDIELAKKIAISLLGDPSGSGVRLKKTHNKEFIDFVIRQHEDAYDTFKQYRALLDRLFEKKFYPLDI
jgi:hypothetical protein